ncbi:hypothetical protein BH24DEI2_BH24DEI2_28210 [soil metagenome]
MKRFFYLLTVLTFCGSLAAAQTYRSSAERSVRYEIMPVENSGVSGSVLILDYGAETVVVISVTGTQAGNTHPAHFHTGDVGSGGDIVVPLKDVDGANGLSITVLDTPYDTIVEGDHYVNIHLSPDDLGTIVASGEVGAGATALTGDAVVSDSQAFPGIVLGVDDSATKPEEFDTLRTRSYQIYAVNGGGITGTVQVTERTTEEGGGTRNTISLEGTRAGSVHPAHFHAGNCGGNGAIVVPLESATGAAGSSVTYSDASFDTIVQGDHYINIHLSPDALGTIVACGEVGAGVR